LLNCTKIDFRRGSAPDPAGGAYSTPPDPLAVFKEPTSKGREGRERKEERGREREKGKAGERKERERDLPDQCQTASMCFQVYFGFRKLVGCRR